MMLTSPTSPAAIHETGTLAPMDANILFRGREHRKQSIHAPSEPTQSRKPCIRQYERQKREKNALNQQIAELLECLDREKAHQKLRRESKMVSPRADSAWKMVAQRHWKRRVASESLQKWLQAAVTEKAAVIDELIELLRQHMRVATLIAAQSHGPYSDTVLQPTGELLYGMYSSEIRGAYRQTDAVFSTSGLGIGEETLAFRRSLITDRGTDFIQFGWKNLFPFTFQRTNESLWMLAHLVDRQEARESYDVVDDPDNTIALKFRVIGRQVDDTSESLIHRLLGRRFNEANRVIHVWKSSIIGDGQYRGMQIDETGWRIIQPSTSGTGTMTQVCVARQLPLHRFSAHTPPASTVQQFEEFVQNMVLENCQEATEVLETLLLDDAFTGIYFHSTQL